MTFSFEADQRLYVTLNTSNDDASKILRELAKSGWFLVPGTEGAPSSFVVHRK